MSLETTHPLLVDEPIPINGFMAAGSVPPLVAPRAQRRVVWLDLDSQWYPGFQLKVWLNPSHLAKRLDQGDETAQGVAFFKLVVLEHNGWCDEDGEPYPPATEAAFWDAIPQELGREIVARIRAEMTSLPNSTGARNNN